MAELITNNIPQDWITFSPTIANFTAGAATIEAYYQQIGKTVNVRLRITLAADSSISGSLTLTLPVAKASTENGGIPIGPCRFFDATGSIYAGYITAAGTIICFNAASTYVVEAFLSSTVPFTWTTSDTFYLSCTYEAE